MTKFSGVIPPVVTPLTESGQLDTKSPKKSIDRMIDAGVMHTQKWQRNSATTQ